jgi:hypothetical protein
MPGENKLEYSLAGDGAHITYAQVTTDDNGPTQSQSLSYQGPDGQGSWSGNAIRFQGSELGTLLTVTLQVIQATMEETILTLLLPDVEPKLGPAPEPIQTLAIRTRRIDPTIGPPATGQVQTYQVYHLEGTRTFSMFP